MNNWFSTSPYINLVVLILIALSIPFALISIKILNNPRKKSYNDKALLKQLLEGFGLEIPLELKDLESKVIK